MIILYLFIIYKWTIGIYFCADNDLERYAIQNIEEIKEVGSNQYIAIPIQIDYSTNHKPSTCQRYFIKKDTIEFIYDIGEVNTGDPNTLIDFVNWISLNYNAENYCIIIWGHGNGWKFTKQEKGAGYDESSNDWFSVSEGELRYAMQKIKEIIGKNINILSFDACAMGEIEVITEINDYVNFICASQDIVPLNGFPYKEIFNYITKNYTTKEKEFCDSIVSKYAKYYTKDTVNLARIELTYIKEANQIIEELADLLKNERNVIEAIKDLHNFANLSYIDLYSFAQNIETGLNFSSETKQKANELKEIINKAIFCKSTRKAYGLSIWFPEHYSTFIELAFDYINLQFSKYTKWEKALFNFYNVQDTIPPTTPEIKEIHAEDNLIEIIWSKSYDFTEIEHYELHQIYNLNIKLQDGAENGLNNWESNGFNLSDFMPKTGKYSFFSKNGYMITNVLINNGIIEFYYKQNGGSLCIFYSNDKENWILIDCISEINKWKRMQFELHSCKYIKLKFQASGGSDWVQIDDISIYSYDSTTSYITNNLSYKEKKAKGTYSYRIRAKDINNNFSMWSEIKSIEIKNFLNPYCYPNPVKKEAFIVYDIPKDETGNLYIYSLSGKLVYKDEINGLNNKIYWNAKNLSTGIYIGIIKSKSINRKFKFAKSTYPK